ncbi:unnamed protein product [Prunus armeniaca]|uniref:Uncharacterized protein n=1 Tax=Prunus armeniaca TaxID=36596 RepID=A0A6J5UEB3_PRUAR|nr:unnamed protein product [Prunus armeniaca]
MASQHERGANDASSREQSPDLGEVERERVRQIVRGWMETGISDHSSNVAPWTNVMAVGMVKLNMPLWIINVEAAGMIVVAAPPVTIPDQPDRTFKIAYSCLNGKQKVVWESARIIGEGLTPAVRAKPPITDPYPKITVVSATRAVPSIYSRHFREYLVETVGETLLVFLISNKRSTDVVDSVEVFRLHLGKLSWRALEIEHCLLG